MFLNIFQYFYKPLNFHEHSIVDWKFLNQRYVTELV